MSDINHLPDPLVKGSPVGADQWLAHVYAELRQLARAKMAREQPGQTLQPTALVHEAWLRLGGQRFENRAHFFGAAAEAMRRRRCGGGDAAEAMRRILVEAARRKHAARRGGGQVPLDVDEIQIAAPLPDDELLAVHEALDRLAAHDAQKAELVKLRYFAGLSIEETAAALGISERTAKRHWTYARAWLLDAMRAS